MTRNFFKISICLIFGTAIEGHSGHQMSNICTQEILITRLNCYKFLHFGLKYLKTCLRDPLDIIFVFQQVDDAEHE